MTADDLTPGTPRPARVGETVSTAAELDALPVGSVAMSPLPRLTIPVPFERRERGWQQPGSESIYETALMADRPLPATVLFRPDAPQPAATGNSAFPVADDAVERAARAAWAEAYDENQRPDHPWDAPWVKQAWTDIARAALAAAGAGAEVDREALAQVIASWFGAGRSGPVYLNIEGTRSPNGDAHSLAAAILDARGDAAAPTEVEWGVRCRVSPSAGRVYRMAEVDARRSGIEMPYRYETVQRTVSAWREVEGGEQRG